MKQVGVTAGVLKVIAAVKGAAANSSDGPATSGKKRKAAAAVDEKTQPKLSAFFTKK